MKWNWSSFPWRNASPAETEAVSAHFVSMHSLSTLVMKIVRINPKIEDERREKLTYLYVFSLLRLQRVSVCLERSLSCSSALRWNCQVTFRVSRRSLHSMESSTLRQRQMNFKHRKQAVT